MQSNPSLFLRLLAVSAIAAVSVLTPVSARTPALEVTFQEDQAADAEEMFSDASFGVDPMVTGPVSQEFRARQLDLGCAEAKWPNVPTGCYPQ